MRRHIYASVVWFMVAHSKKYILSEACKEYLCRISYWNAFFAFRDYFIRRQDYPNPLFYENISNHKYIDYISSLLIRASFGGMEGDILMLTSFADIWFERGKMIKVTYLFFLNLRF